VKRTWGSTKWGEIFTSIANWQLTLESHTVSITVSGKSDYFLIGDISDIVIKSGIIWSEVVLTSHKGNQIQFDGIPNHAASEMRIALKQSLKDYQSTQAAKFRLDAFKEFLPMIEQWGHSFYRLISQGNSPTCWISRDMVQSALDSKPSGNLRGMPAPLLLQTTDIQAYIKTLDEQIQKIVTLWQSDLEKIVAGHNRSHLDKELAACKDFLNTVEKSPLTEAQAKSVICFENRIQVIASAGSGKTSTMIAKAGYALHRKRVSADKILLLAFNTDAAKELKKRIQTRLAPLGFDADKINATTFHAFGLGLIGHATGKKPSLARWLEHGQDIQKLAELIDVIKDRDFVFRAKWDLFRMVFSRDLQAFGTPEAHEDVDRETKKTGFKTLKGDLVKSHEERVIADWLYYHGVNYCYERPYEIETADKDHRQYTPDFYYPDAKLYHEHFALDKEGKAPPEFGNYVEGVLWKREQHKKNATLLTETTSAQIKSGEAFSLLAATLAEHNITLDPNPERPTPGRKIITNKELIKLFRVFLTHAKNNQLDDATLLDRSNAQNAGQFAYRHVMFLDLFKTIRAEWEAALKQEGVIDFEDMLNLAADHLESGMDTPYELVMVDEFQDTSHARIRMVRSLVSKPHRYLFAVGDDWQSINRFAGADISAMTQFESWFGKNEVYHLERTFRCTQSICDASSQFVIKNPSQIQKTVISEEAEHAHSLRVFQVQSDSEIAGLIDKYLDNLCKAIVRGTVTPPANKKTSVFILGRYNKDQHYLPYNWHKKYNTYLDVSFLTIHASKGLEADYVILPRMVNGAYSFPSSIEDDPVLQLAMPSEDTFLFAEERRLFYVALTRARRTVALMTVEGRYSPFVVELISDNKLDVHDINGNSATITACPRCKTGVIVEKRSEYGVFKACNNHPKCTYIDKRDGKNKFINTQTQSRKRKPSSYSIH
jgi:DNA helicase-4